MTPDVTANGASPSETAAEGYSRAGSKNATPLTAHYPLMDGRALGGRARPLPSLDGHPTIKDVIYHELRERIVVGELASGDRLVEADLAARFGVSKTPVREALLTLEAEGLIRLRPHRGAEVSRLSIEEWHDLIFLRDVLEIGALDDIVASMTEEHFAAAEQAVAAMEEAFKARDYRCYRQVQRRLHATILGAPGHPSLPEAAVRLNDRLDRYGWILTTRDPSRWAEDLAMNRRRLELIRAGDTATYAHMIRSRHAEASALVAQADALAEHRLEDVPGRSRRETGKE